MQTETVREALDWTSAFHTRLRDCLRQCSDRSPDERSVLLLDYLAAHEDKLAKLISAFQAEASTDALNTWCNEYFNKNPIVPHKFCEMSLSQLTPDEIMELIAFDHAQVIELYKNLLDRAVIPSLRELLKELVALEEHEMMIMMQGANRLTDI